MNIILVWSATSRARTLTVDWRHWTLACLSLAGLLVAVAAAFNYVAPHFNFHTARNVLPQAVIADMRDTVDRNQELRQSHINALAIRVGELQARMLRLDGLGERLARMAGFEPHEWPSLQPGAAPGRGGAESSRPSRVLSVEDLTAILDKLTHAIDDRSDQLGAMEARLVNDSVKRQFVPTLAPIVDGWFSSNFGDRIDPFTGLHTFHEGIDFPAEPGTPIVAAASGTVISTELHPQYGKMVEIDHGNGLVSRYAHTSRLFVKDGDLVVRGQRVATVGSTGRSTGPHLHFEVRQNGIPQNPARFLQSSN